MDMNLLNFVGLVVFSAIGAVAIVVTVRWAIAANRRTKDRLSKPGSISDKTGKDSANGK
jgi:hypothetical protein